MTTNDTSRSLSQWLDFLLAQHPTEIELGLGRIRQVAEHMDLLSPDATVITLAGTNGKGTTAALLETSLLGAGYRVGCFSSPHLLRYNERVRINGQELEDAAHCAAFAAVEQARDDTPLTFFEVGALAALWLFAREPLDVLLLEIGLGGRLDAVNMIDADVSVITSIDVDHQDWLGSDREQIGREKAGIMRAGRPVVCGDPNPPASIRSEAERIGARLLQRGQDFALRERHDGWHWLALSAFELEHELPKWPKPQIPLDNAATAWQVLQVSDLKVSESQYSQALSKVRVAGRLQTLHDSPKVIVDVAHNPHAARYLARQLHERFYEQQVPLYAVVGMLSDKDQTEVLSTLKQTFSRWYLASLDTTRGSTAQQLAEKLPEGEQSKLYSQVRCALRQAMTDAGQDGVVVVFGSFYTVADAINELEA